MKQQIEDKFKPDNAPKAKDAANLAYQVLVALDNLQQKKGTIEKEETIHQMETIKQKKQNPPAISFSQQHQPTTSLSSTKQSNNLPFFAAIRFGDIYQ